MSIKAKHSLKGTIGYKLRLTGTIVIGTVIEDNTQTYILVDEDGNEIPAVLVDERVELTATPNDIRLGVTAVTDDGVVTGEKEIPSYNTYEGYRAVPAKSQVALPHTHYDYTKLQAVFCKFNTSPADSVATDKVAINNCVYNVNSTAPVSSIIRDTDRKLVDFGFNNDSSTPCIIRYFMYKEIY